VIKTADWVIDLGPEGGSGGGSVVATGTPEQVAAEPASYTGRFLRRVLDIPDRPAPAARKRSAGRAGTKSAAIRTPARTRR
jgi:excinuclease ABC subunit A